MFQEAIEGSCLISLPKWKHIAVY